MPPNGATASVAEYVADIVSFQPGVATDSEFRVSCKSSRKVQQQQPPSSPPQ